MKEGSVGVTRNEPRDSGSLLPIPFFLKGETHDSCSDVLKFVVLFIQKSAKAELFLLEGKELTFQGFAAFKNTFHFLFAPFY